MDDPQRAGAAEARELQPRCGVPLGDIARHIDTAEEHRDAARAGTLEGREAVASLFEADPIVHPQPVDIVAHRAGAGAERGIGHQHRAGGVVGEADVK